MNAIDLHEIANRLRPAVKPFVNVMLNIPAASRLRHLAEESAVADCRIRVAFLLQCPEVWDKQEDIYEFMWNDSRFDPILVTLPDPSVRDWDSAPLSEMDRGADYLCKEKYADRIVVEGVDQSGHIADLQSLGFEYVFYQRPYDAKLPREYRSASVSAWSRVCHVPYGYILAPVYERLVFLENEQFFRNASFTFHESNYMRALMVELWGRRPGAKYRNFESLGYPALGRYASISNDGGCCRRILWTPRWSLDETTGGSHFLSYKDEVLSLVNSGLELRLRPHQLMWGELVSRGEMSEEEIDAYRTKMVSSGCSFSDNKDCLADFEWSHVLITDFSSIVVEYFLTGRPIIYCPPPYEVNRLMHRLLDGVYVARSWSDVERFVLMLSRGEDPKRKLRSEIARSEYGNVSNAASLIAQRIYDDRALRLS